MHTVHERLRVPIFGSGHPRRDAAAGDVPGGGPPGLGGSASDPLAVLTQLALRPLFDLGLLPKEEAKRGYQRSFTPWGTLVQETGSAELSRRNIFGAGGSQ